MSLSILSRRNFLRTAGTVPLIGTALAESAYQPTKVAALKGSSKSVIIPTHEFAGNLDERLDFPNDWGINVMHMKDYGAPVLTPQQIAEALKKPIGTPPLRELRPARPRRSSRMTTSRARPGAT